MNTTGWITIVVVVAIVFGLIGYFAAPKGETKVITKPPTLKAAFIYVGDIGDYGWTHAHETARLWLEDHFSWLNTTCVENVGAEDARQVIENLISQGYTVIFGTSFDHMIPMKEAAENHTDIIFFHCSGYIRRPNMGTYMADFYQVYYLNGLMAGALTKTNKIGYVAAHTIPEVVRHADAFALGVKEVNPDAEIYVRVIHAWYDPEKAQSAANALLAEGVDAIAFTEDSPTVLQTLESKMKETGTQYYGFSHYSPMQDIAPNVTVSGQLVHWEVIYADILSKIYSGLYTNSNLQDVDYWGLLDSGAVELGGKPSVPINPKFVNDLKSVTVTDKLTGEELSVYDLVMRRLDQMKDKQMVFDPFEAYNEPIMGWPKGGSPEDLQVMIPIGHRLTYHERLVIDWWVDNVVSVGE